MADFGRWPLKRLQQYARETGDMEARQYLERMDKKAGELVESMLEAGGTLKDLLDFLDERIAEVPVSRFEELYEILKQTIKSVNDLTVDS